MSRNVVCDAAVLVPLLLLAACGGAPPTLDEQLAALEAAPRQEGDDHGRVGWWRYLAGDPAGAAAAFAEGGAAPLAALGRARLAADRLAHGEAMTEAALASAGPELSAVVARRWAEDAAEQVRDGAARLHTALGDVAGARVPLEDPRYTVRVSFLPHLDLVRLHQRPPVLDGERVGALGKWWALSERAPQADRDGLVITVWPLPSGDAHLELRVGGPVIAWRGGAPVLATAPERHPPGTVRFSAPGEGPLVVAWAAPRRPSAWRLAHPAPAPGPERGPPVPDRRGGVDWLGRYLRAERALLDEDPEEARGALEGAPDSPAFAVLRARLAALEPDLPDRAARDIALDAWSRALPLAPARAHLELGQQRWRAGQLDEAARHLQEAVRLAPEGAQEAWRSLARVALAGGHPDEARRAIDAAARLAPDPCALLDDRAALLAGRGGREADRLIEDYATCDRPLEAAERLLDLYRPEAALERLDALPEAQRGGKARTLRARALLGVGRLEEARALYAEGGDPGSALAAADLGPTVDAEATLEADLRRIVEQHPTAREALDLVGAWRGWSPFAALELDSEALIAEYEAEPPLSGPAVRVLDHSALLFFADGKSLRWVHEVLAIRSRDAAETFGEIGLPGDVRLFSLYTRKADGRRLYADEQPEKDTISLPDLKDGDYVVAVYLEPSDNGYLYDSGFLAPRVYFRGVDLPIFRQRFEVYAPDDVRPVAQRLNDAPEPQRVALGGRAGLRFDARQVPLLPPEPDPVPAGLWLPSVRTGQGVTLSDDLDYLRDRVLARRRRTAAFDAWARAYAGEGDGRRRAKRLARAVREAVDGAHGVIAEDAVRAIRTGSGNRALVLSAALEAEGIRHRLLLTRPKVHVPAGPFLQVADFVYPLIELADGTWIDPGPDRAPPGFIPFPMVGSDGLVAWPPAAPAEPVPLPAERAVGDAREVSLVAHWDAEGVLHGEVVDRLVGQEAMVVGEHLSRLEPAQRPRLVERLLVAAVGAAHVTELEDPTRQDPDGPLVLRYKFTAKVGDTLNLGLFPVSPARSWAGLSERRIPLAIDLPTRQHVHLELTSARDFTARHRAGEHREGPHRFRLEVQGDEDSLYAEAWTEVAGGAIAPADYSAFAGWARRAESAERIVLRRASSASGFLPSSSSPPAITASPSP